MSALVWLRNDLRSSWHSPLDYAIEHHQQVRALYCLTPQQWQQYHLAPCKVNLIIDRLRELKTELAERNVELFVIDSGDYQHTPQAIIDFCQQHNIQSVYFNAEYEWDERVRDKQFKKLCDEQSFNVAKFHDTCIVRPELLQSKQATPYKMFTPYFRTWLDELYRQFPQPQALSVASIVSPAAEQLELASYYQQTHVAAYSASGDDIYQQLSCFIAERAPDYGLTRDFPALDSTSHISHLLAIGAISAKQCVFMLQQEYAEKLNEPTHGVHIWLKELAWRDFYRYVMFHFTHVNKNLPFQKHYRYFKWNTDQAHFKAWQNGMTGYPIVDAAMRALKATGWMHNRLRMVVASFYCKHLMLPWRWAEDYFMSQLIDGDFASNNGGWQWSASVGTDAAPYFRIFNPTAQSQKFDLNGEFIKRWVPELSSLSAKHIHQPSKYVDVYKLAYPLPIVDHASSVANTKLQFKQFIELSQQ
ncbi:cryptochrome/photolyase family protein [Paraglaciecola hydrolytica]|uniref:Deoxyribodipyrimidine photo-lyase n=1 Tax=Paraglaciecola hydrolytica TaxID=1799789 RepID=A0A136A6H7_9ALTE|nr:FAD-binding domain-containing protein [Paraglaciecola hydrolytica]KXI30821.1 deoxyribodipyrimidine photolyase [Paraglaciecola hydrolytica]